MKKIVSVVLVVTVIVNVIGFGFLNVRSSAAFVVDDAIYVAVGGIIISLLAGAAGNAILLYLFQICKEDAASEEGVCFN